MIVVDTNVFVIEKRYKRDAHFSDNHRFLMQLRRRGDGATTLANLLEFAGVVSFCLSPEQFVDTMDTFSEHFGMAVVPRGPDDLSFPPLSVSQLLTRISSRLAFGDALVLELAEADAPAGSLFVTWDAKHFVGKTRLEVLTPAQVLRRWRVAARPQPGRTARGGPR